MDNTSAGNEALCGMERYVRPDYIRVTKTIDYPVPGASSTTYPEWTWPNYPEGFQGTQIPVHGPYIAKLIEDRADGNIP